MEQFEEKNDLTLVHFSKNVTLLKFSSRSCSFSDEKKKCKGGKVE